MEEITLCNIVQKEIEMKKFISNFKSTLKKRNNSFSGEKTF